MVNVMALLGFGAKKRKKKKMKNRISKSGINTAKGSELLFKLLDAFGTSGNEDEIRNLITQEIRKSVDDFYVDKLGSLIAHKKGSRPRVMLAAHMDEIGLMVKRISDNGQVYCATIGGISPVMLIGQRVKIKTKTAWIEGVITNKEACCGEVIKEEIKIGELFVDTGLGKEELEKTGVEIGSYVMLEQKSSFLNKDIFFGKALDDRIGCYILIELAKRLRNAKNEIFFVFTVQEEIGLYGAKTSAYYTEPDWAIAVDVTDADDAKKSDATRSVGYGPCITVKDANMIANKCINGWLKNVAKEKKIPVQLDVSDAGTTDAITISISRGGVPSAVVGVPVRNLHTTISIASMGDIEKAIALLESLLKNPPKVCLV